MYIIDKNIFKFWTLLVELHFISNPSEHEL